MKVHKVTLQLCFPVSQGNASPIENLSENEMDDYELECHEKGNLASQSGIKKDKSRTSLPSIELISALADSEKTKPTFPMQECAIDEGNACGGKVYIHSLVLGQGNKSLLLATTG